VDAQGITLLAALAAGSLSFFSPCVLPIVPVYLAYITGATTTRPEGRRRLWTVVHALSFVLGFGLVFVGLGAGAGALGGLLYPALPYLTKVGGLIMILLGLHMVGLMRVPWLQMERRVGIEVPRGRGLLTSFLVGLTFAAGWTPCVGTVLTAILLLAAGSQTAARGATLLVAYTAGIGLPFLVVAGFLDLAAPTLRRVGRHLRAASVVGGALLITMGLLLITDRFQAVIFWLNTLARRG
jgi:cytochrome c-type biogenesis protein